LNSFFTPDVTIAVYKDAVNDLWLAYVVFCPSALGRENGDS
jgi:hypothetical protein